MIVNSYNRINNNVNRHNNISNSNSNSLNSNDNHNNNSNSTIQSQSKSVKVWQINTSHSPGSMAELQFRMQSDHQIALVTEPYWKKGPNSVFKVPNITNCNIVSGPESSRAIIVVNKAIKYWVVNQFTATDMTTIYIEGPNGPIFLVSVYMDILKEIPKLLIEFLEKYKGNANYVIGTDSNAHSTLWGNKDTNPRGKKVEEMLFKYDLYLANTGSQATFIRKNCATFIDLTIVSRGLEDKIAKWKVDTLRSSASDHRYIEFQINMSIESVHSKPNYKKCNWNRMRNLIQAKLEDFCSQHDMTSAVNFDKYAEDLNLLIKEALNASCPMSKPVKNRIMPWWTKELTQLRTEVNLAEKRALKFQKWNQFHRKRNEYFQKIRKEKERSWQEFCTELESLSTTSKIVKVLSHNSTKEIGFLKNANGSMTETPSETLDLLMQVHFPKCEDLESLSNEPSPIVWSPSSNTSIPINGDTVKEAFMALGPDKAPGPDGLSPRVMQNLPQNIYDMLSKMYKLCLTNGYSPKCWREMKVIFIPKHGKESYDSAKSFRPITLSNVVLKGIEKLVKNHIKDGPLKTPLANQHGFTEGRSCDTALSEVTKTIEMATLRGEICLGVSLDIQGAFDNLQFETITRKMKGIGIKDEIISWYDHLLKNRKIVGDINNASCAKQPKQGTPQGGILSPDAWNISNQGLLDLFQYDTDGIKAIGLADDTMLLLRGTNLKIMLKNAKSNR